MAHVKGLDLFLSHFKGFEEQYVLIGGAACSVWLAHRDVDFRMTKDIDLVLIVEGLVPAFVERFWDFVNQGGYQVYRLQSGKRALYRFDHPAHAGYPAQIELLSRKPFDTPRQCRVMPLPAGGTLTSLSVILMEDEYYHFVVAARQVVDGVPIIPAYGLIPLKARAWLDLTERRAQGDASIRTEDIRKHRNDVFRLAVALEPVDRFSLPGPIGKDLSRFLANFPPASPDWPAIRRSLGTALPDPETIISRLQAVFELKAETAQKRAERQGSPLAN
jgi:hypothetical protein